MASHIGELCATSSNQTKLAIGNFEEPTVMATRIQDLPIEARLKLVEDLWDSIAADQQKLPLTDAQKAELDDRFDEFEADGDLGDPAEVVLAQIRRNL